MSEARYAVKLVRTVPARRRRRIAARLAVKMGADPERIRALLGRKPGPITKAIPEVDAAQIHAYFLQEGVEVELIDVAAREQTDIFKTSTNLKLTSVVHRAAAGGSRASGPPAFPDSAAWSGARSWDERPAPAAERNHAVRLIAQVPPQRIDGLVKRLARRLQVEPERLRRLLSRPPGLLSKRITRATAERITSILSAEGVAVESVRLHDTAEGGPGSADFDLRLTLDMARMRHRQQDPGRARPPGARPGVEASGGRSGAVVAPGNREPIVIETTSITPPRAGVDAPAPPQKRRRSRTAPGLSPLPEPPPLTARDAPPADDHEIAADAVAPAAPIERARTRRRTIDPAPPPDSLPRRETEGTDAPANQADAAGSGDPAADRPDMRPIPRPEKRAAFSAATELPPVEIDDEIDASSRSRSSSGLPPPAEDGAPRVAKLPDRPGRSGRVRPATPDPAPDLASERSRPGADLTAASTPAPTPERTRRSTPDFAAQGAAEWASVPSRPTEAPPRERVDPGRRGLYTLLAFDLALLALLGGAGPALSTPGGVTVVLLFSLLLLGQAMLTRADRWLSNLFAALAVAPMFFMFPALVDTLSPWRDLTPDLQLVVISLLLLLSSLFLADTLGLDRYRLGLALWHRPRPGGGFGTRLGRALGASVGGLLLQLAIGASGLSVGLLALRYLPPAPDALGLAGSTPLLALVALLCAGLSQELFFRGLLQRVGTRALGAPIGILLPALLFVLLYAGGPLASNLLFALLLALASGLTAHITGSVLGLSLMNALALAIYLGVIGDPIVCLRGGFDLACFVPDWGRSLAALMGLP